MKTNCIWVYGPQSEILEGFWSWDLLWDLPVIAHIFVLELAKTITGEWDLGSYNYAGNWLIWYDSVNLTIVLFNRTVLQNKRPVSQNNS